MISMNAIHYYLYVAYNIKIDRYKDTEEKYTFSLYLFNLVKHIPACTCLLSYDSNKENVIIL